MKKIYSLYTLLVMALVGLSLTACSNDDLDTNQYKGGFSLNAYGPNPVMRGGTLRFVGSNLDQVASIQIPGVAAITNYEIVKSGVPSEIRVVVPKDGPTEGNITLTSKTNETIQTVSELTTDILLRFAFLRRLRPVRLNCTLPTSPYRPMKNSTIRLSLPIRPSRSVLRALPALPAVTLQRLWATSLLRLARKSKLPVPTSTWLLTSPLAVSALPT